MQNECFLAYHSYLEICSSLNDAEFGRLMRAALIYSATNSWTKVTWKVGGNNTPDSLRKILMRFLNSS